MGLDVYVGSLTRYYLGDWKTIVEQMASEMGMKVQVIRKTSDDAVHDPVEVRRIVEKWRGLVSGGLKKHLKAPLDWVEGERAPYYTDKPDWDGYAALLLWASYDDHPEMKRPEKATSAWDKDPAYVASSKEDSKTRYRSLLGKTEMWLPCDFDFVFTCEDAPGNQITIGSSHRLVADLAELNRRTWNADAQALAQANHEGPDESGSLEAGARYAFSIFTKLAGLSVSERLPMKLDY